MYELLRKSTCSGSSYIRQFTPTPSPQAITYGLREQQVKSNSCRCTVYAHFWWSPTSSPGRFSLALGAPRPQSQGKAPWGRGWVVTPQHGKASAFGFTVFPFVVQAKALGHRLQSESNRKQ